MAASPLMTVDEYFHTPETVRPAELRYGVLHVAESPSPQHQSAVAQLFRLLDAHVRGRDVGEVWLAPLDAANRSCPPYCPNLPRRSTTS